MPFTTSSSSVLKSIPAGNLFIFLVVDLLPAGAALMCPILVASSTGMKLLMVFVVSPG